MLVVLIAAMVIIASSLIMIPQAAQSVAPAPPQVQQAAESAALIPIAFGIAAFVVLVGMLALKSRRASSSLHF